MAGNIPPLDADFQPPILFNRAYEQSVCASGRGVAVMIGLEREQGLVSRYQTTVLPEADADTVRYVDRMIKFLLWSRGGWRIYFAGPRAIGERIIATYSAAGARRFDVDLMARVYERAFEVVLTELDNVPAACETGSAVGGFLDGCRIGFDLGASDYKIAAVENGVTIYADEFPWNPRDQADPAYHYGHLTRGLKAAAAKLPRVDAIGGSSAGIIVKNKVMAASLFRSVPPAEFPQASQIFLRIGAEWGVPVEVANDGDVTALAGAMALRARGVLGLAMGSSEAAGFLDPHGKITGWLNELAFAPVDFNETAAVDEWSGDQGVGAMYFSQQAINRLLPAAGIQLPESMPVPDKLKEVQRLIARQHDGARKIYETIGIYLGYTIPYYAHFYDLTHLLVLGRVTTGAGGDIVIAKARDVLQKQFPEVAASITVHVPDESTRRVGQAVAAASLPRLK